MRRRLFLVAFSHFHSSSLPYHENCQDRARFNRSRSFTWVPIGVMVLSAVLGGIDDLLNIFGSERRSRKLAHILTLIKVHKEWRMRTWYIVTLPWTMFK